MEVEGAKHIFEHSIKKHKLGYVEFLGNGNTKSYVNVKDTYPGIEIKKLECVGHYQKRVGTRLRNLKKKEKRLGGPDALLMLLLTDYIIMQVSPFDKVLGILKV